VRVVIRIDGRRGSLARADGQPGSLARADGERGSLARADGERGSLIIAISVVLVLTGLAIAVLARTVSALVSSRTSQDTAAALAAADAGLSDALYQLDQLSLDTTPPPAIPPTSGPAQSGTVGAGAGYEWRATEASGDPNTYTIVSVGTVNGRSHSVTETVSRTPRYPFALFANGGLFFNSKSSTLGNINAETGGSVIAGGTAGIASNHAVVIGSGQGGGTSQTFYSPAGSCGGCPKPVSAAGPYLTAEPAAPAGALPCPFAGVVDGTTDPRIIDAGTYLCTGDLTLTGQVSVATSPGSPVVIYMTNGSDGRGAPSTLHLGGLAMAAPTVGTDATGLQILKAGPGTVDPGDGGADTPHFTGVIDAPEANFNSPTCEMSAYGALLLGVFNCGGSGNGFHLYYDRGVSSLLSDAWRASGYHEIPTPSSI
jgi:hypothetical protein